MSADSYHGYASASDEFDAFNQDDILWISDDNLQPTCQGSDDFLVCGQARGGRVGRRLRCIELPSIAQEV